MSRAQREKVVLTFMAGGVVQYSTASYCLGLSQMSTTSSLAHGYETLPGELFEY